MLAVICILVFVGESIAAPLAPQMTLSTQGQSITVSWVPIQGATGYTLAYAQYPWQPWMTMDDIHYVDMGTATNISFLLWEGAAYYAAVQAYDNQGSSGFSNIDYFVMGPPTPTWVDDDKDGSREVDGDCDDANIYVYPGAVDACGDGIDADCNGADAVCDPSDIDNDGDGLSERQGDCDDANIYVYPGAVDACGDGIDADCNGSDLSCRDVDNDQDGVTENQGDCNDLVNSIHPGATEICGNNIDEDCDGRDSKCYPALSVGQVYNFYIAADGTHIYQFTAPLTGYYIISVTNTMSDLSWFIADDFYYNSPIDFDCDQYDYVANDEICSIPSQLIAGNTYYLFIDEWSSVSGSYSLVIRHN